MHGTPHYFATGTHVVVATNSSGHLLQHTNFMYTKLKICEITQSLER